MIINWFDFMILTWILATSVRGLKRGFCGAFFYLIGFYLAFFALIFLAEPLIYFFQIISQSLYLRYPHWIAILFYLILFMIVLLVMCVFGIVPRKWFNKNFCDIKNQYVGLFLGLVFGILTLGLWLNFMQYSTSSFVQKHIFNDSFFSYSILELFLGSFDWIMGSFLYQDFLRFNHELGLL